VLGRLLDGGHSTVAGRLAAAFRGIGNERIADDIVDAMRAVGYTVHEVNPFADTPSGLAVHEPSPYINRLGMNWQRMREQVLDIFPRPPRKPPTKRAYLQQVDDVYLLDAYHSLSIEGYRVSTELIERVRAGVWKHVPPRAEAVRELMPAFFGLLQQESDPAVRVVLGHFVFVNIHPYTDGNGRIGRFIMNTMLAASGSSWTVIPVEQRSEYMATLETASVEGDIAPFAQFIGQLVSHPAI
jgi:hypothetical protein